VLATGTDQETQAAVEAVTPAQAPEAAAPAEAPEADQDTASAELQDAFKAYSDAKEAAQEEDLKADLDSYVAAGKITQEQADLILNYYKEREAIQDGVCPNCGYEFQYARGGKGGRHMGMGGNFAGSDSSFGGKGNRSGNGSQAFGNGKGRR